MICQNAECGHPATIHGETGCRKTRCVCKAFVMPESATAPRTRRVCIDVPDGYVLSVSLIPDREPME